MSYKDTLSKQQKDTIETLASVNGYIDVDVDNMSGNDVNGMNSWSHEKLPNYLSDLNELSKSYQKIIEKHKLGLGSTIADMQRDKRPNGGYMILNIMNQVENDWRYLFVGVLNPEHVAHQLAYIAKSLEELDGSEI